MIRRRSEEDERLEGGGCFAIQYFGGGGGVGKTHWKAYTRRQGDIQHMLRELDVGNVGTTRTLRT